MRAHPVRTDGFDPCIPTFAARPPSGPNRVHEIKHDGYRLIARRDGNTVHLFTRRGHDWTDRHSASAAAAGKLRARSFTIDGEAVVVGVDALALFDALHRRHKATEAILYAFDLLELDGEDAPCPSVPARRSWRGCWRASRPASSTTSTPTRTAPRCSGTPANWASRASCRSGWRRPTGPGRRVIGSRSRIRTARRCGGRVRGDGSPARFRQYCAIGVRTRGLDIATNAKRQVADAAARAEAKAVIDRWNEQLAASRDMRWSPTIRAALIAGTPWLDVFCPGCGTSRAIDLRKVDRHPLASVAILVLGLRCSWCPELAPMPRILGLHALPPAAWKVNKIDRSS